MSMWKVPRIWPEANIIIIGGGPSFKKVDQSVLRQLKQDSLIRVIGLNKAFKAIPDSNKWIDVIHFVDAPFYRAFRYKKDGIYSFKGLLVGACADVAGDKRVKYVGRDKVKRLGLTTNQRRVRWQKNSGSSGINLAYHFGGPGCNVFLFGFDMKKDKHGKGHWHDGYPEKGKNKKETEMPFSKWAASFPAIAKDAKKLKFNIYNVNIDSAITDFPKITFNEFVDMVKKETLTNEQ